MSKLWIVPAILGAAVLTCGAGGSPTTSDRYAYSTYRERADRITILVDSYPAALHGEDRYIPLVVAIGLNDRREPVTVTPESFTLLDSRGSPVALASYAEIARDYGKRQFDAAFLRSHPLVVGNQFAGSLRVRADFFPALAGGALRVDHIQLYPFTWFRTVLYFPRPEAGLGGVMTLRLSGEGMQNPVDVRFVIPNVLGRKPIARAG